jgi:hypothetical protein
MSEQQILETRIRDIDARLAEIEAQLAHDPTGETYRRQELASERVALVAHRRVAERRLKELRGDVDPGERARTATALARRDALRAQRTQAIRQQCLETAEQFEQLRDYRNAKIWRLQALDAHKQAEHEIH